jgi:hypothetical protein
VSAMFELILILSLVLMMAAVPVYLISGSPRVESVGIRMFEAGTVLFCVWCVLFIVLFTLTYRW